MKPNKHTRKNRCEVCTVSQGSRHNRYCAWAYAKQPDHKTKKHIPFHVKVKSIIKIIKA